ncbi:hypothetical protein N7481_007186 [Penicillium waksmanii]|uniref:uncharacterized protein n=1 Tax=Penicillium waksmanii TaxID=69791 RepID=UPI0025470C2F|nr:uncharacterized protein N7481_007186 [Penicillium waksmanii]KAJ5979888.1 hypothetical protein N7481_007186 [Penicillium waksmanii]
MLCETTTISLSVDYCDRSEVLACKEGAEIAEHSESIPNTQQEVILWDVWVSRSFKVRNSDWNRDENAFQYVYQPFLMLSQPAVLVTTIVFGLTIGWTVARSFVFSNVFQEPPMLWTARAIGFFNIAPLTGLIVASLASECEKASFLGSARLGSGLIVARLPDGRWSAPCALMTGGAGVGGLFGLELTDFVFVLTSDEAVNALATFGSLTLGLNISMAAGPMGRTAEATGTASRKGVASMLSYSKTRGLYGGVSLEGGVLLERADANKKIYGRKVTAKELLRGDITPPPETASLMRTLNSPCFSSEPAVVSPVEATTDNRPNNVQTESVALPSQTPYVPPTGTYEPNGQISPQRAELHTDPPSDTFELSGGDPQDRPVELESTVSPLSQLPPQTTGDTWPPSVSPLSASDMPHTPHEATARGP